MRVPRRGTAVFYCIDINVLCKTLPEIWLALCKIKDGSLWKIDTVQQKVIMNNSRRYVCKDL